MKYARIRPDGDIESAIFSEQEVEDGYAAGFKLIIENGFKPEITDLQAIESYYKETETEIIASYIVVENHPKVVATEIARLQKILTVDDYKVIKCQEYSLAGEPLPYDIVELHARREAVRMLINELQNLIL